MLSRSYFTLFPFFTLPFQKEKKGSIIFDKLRKIWNGWETENHAIPSRWERGNKEGGLKSPKLAWRNLCTSPYLIKFLFFFFSIIHFFLKFVPILLRYFHLLTVFYLFDAPPTSFYSFHFLFLMLLRNSFLLFLFIISSSLHQNLSTLPLSLHPYTPPVL
jgi:hypothetical protein